MFLHAASALLIGAVSAGKAGEEWDGELYRPNEPAKVQPSQNLSKPFKFSDRPGHE